MFLNYTIAYLIIFSLSITQAQDFRSQGFMRKLNSSRFGYCFRPAGEHAYVSSYSDDVIWPAASFEDEEESKRKTHNLQEAKELRPLLPDNDPFWPAGERTYGGSSSDGMFLSEVALGDIERFKKKYPSKDWSRSYIPSKAVKRAGGDLYSYNDSVKARFEKDAVPATVVAGDFELYNARNEEDVTLYLSRFKEEDYSQVVNIQKSAMNYDPLTYHAVYARIEVVKALLAAGAIVTEQTLSSIDEAYERDSIDDHERFELLELLSKK